MRIGIQIAEELFLLCCQLSYHETQLGARLWLTEDQAVCWIPRLNEIQRVGLERPCSRREVHEHLHSYAPAARVPKKQLCPKHAKAAKGLGGQRNKEQGASRQLWGTSQMRPTWTVSSLALVNMGSRRPHWRILRTPSLSHKNRGEKKNLFSNSRAHDRKAPLKYNLHRHPVLTYPAWVAVKSLLARSNLTAATHLKEPVKSSKRRGKKH